MLYWLVDQQALVVQVQVLVLEWVERVVLMVGTAVWKKMIAARILPILMAGILVVVQMEHMTLAVLASLDPVAVQH